MQYNYAFPNFKAELNKSLEMKLIKSGSTYAFYRYGKMRILILNKMMGNSFLDLDFSDDKPIINMGEICYYRTQQSEYLMARCSITSTGKPTGTIVKSQNEIIAMSENSVGVLYGTLIWFVN